MPGQARHQGIDVYFGLYFKAHLLGHGWQVCFQTSMLVARPPTVYCSTFQYRRFQALGACGAVIPSCSTMASQCPFPFGTTWPHRPVDMGSARFASFESLF